MFGQSRPRSITASSPASSPAGDHFVWDAEGAPAGTLFEELARAEEQDRQRDAGQSRRAGPRFDPEYYELYSDSEDEESEDSEEDSEDEKSEYGDEDEEGYDGDYEEGYLEDPWLFLSAETQDRIQKWVDDQSSWPRSPSTRSPQSSGDTPPSPVRHWSDRSSEPDLEDGALVVKEHREGEAKEDGGPSKGCNYAYCGGCGAYLGTTAGPAGREQARSTRKAAVFLVAAVAALFVARLLGVYLDY